MDDGIEIDEHAMDRLVAIFRRCAGAGIEIPPLMPLDTPAHQRAAAHYLANVLMRYYRGGEFLRDHWDDQD